MEDMFVCQLNWSGESGGKRDGWISGEKKGKKNWKVIESVRKSNWIDWGSLSCASWNSCRTAERTNIDNTIIHQERVRRAMSSGYRSISMRYMKEESCLPHFIFRPERTEQVVDNTERVQIVGAPSGERGKNKSRIDKNPARGALGGSNPIRLTNDDDTVHPTLTSLFCWTPSRLRVQ